MSKKMIKLLMDCRTVSAFLSGCGNLSPTCQFGEFSRQLYSLDAEDPLPACSCQVTSMKRWRLITVCWTEWGMIWIHQGVFSQEPWTNSRWCSRPNPVGGWEPLSLHLLRFFCWYIT
uniref:Uncharacterized protein n=1 Tax=Arundo donax TaxID=35708 RepID=A0A0A9CHR4_ARUDO